jgi:hypothetical protein
MNTKPRDHVQKNQWILDYRLTLFVLVHEKALYVDSFVYLLFYFALDFSPISLLTHVGLVLNLNFIN